MRNVFWANGGEASGLLAARLAMSALVVVGVMSLGMGVSVGPAVAQQKPTPLFFDSRRLPDLEVERRNQEVLQEQRRVIEERRLEAEALAKRRADETRIAAEAERR